MLAGPPPICRCGSTDAIADRTPPKPAAQFLLQIGLDVVFYAADGEAKHHLDK